MNQFERKKYFINKMEFLLKWRTRSILLIIAFAIFIIIATVVCYIYWNNVVMTFNLFLLILFIFPLAQNLRQLKQLSKDLPSILKSSYASFINELSYKPFYSKSKKAIFIQKLWAYDLSQEEVKESSMPF
ncbi:hypothetical protein [Candidatus Mycoplasma mahonii]|uniref:hypothetical protein n=1 Tax=Candidatus Mycoplasma mahonii TaxID=3004105 RepID=UPI0026EA12AC|nr:hypothetical protein [Candidatus Mycoplasma mahonii]WKX02806.1 hypothetical protein O3I44_01905 [Candidatus Mycoplasma mahonii]